MLRLKSDEQLLKRWVKLNKVSNLPDDLILEKGKIEMEILSRGYQIDTQEGRLIPKQNNDGVIYR